MKYRTAFNQAYDKKNSCNMVELQNFEFLIIIFVHKNNWNRYFSPIDFLSFQRCGKALSTVISWTFFIDSKTDQLKNANPEKMVILYLTYIEKVK